MRALTPLLALALCACGEEDPLERSAACGCGPCEAVVAEVTDGDTVTLDTGLKIRYIGVDTPEITKGKNECFGKEARDFNEMRVVGKTVRLEYDRECQDRFDRTLAYVWVGDTLMSERLLEGGYGDLLIIPPNDRYADRLEAAEDRARAADRGIWGEACAAPSE